MTQARDAPINATRFWTTKKKRDIMILAKATHRAGRSILIKTAAMASSLYYYLLFFDFTTLLQRAACNLVLLFGIRRMCKWNRFSCAGKFPSLFFFLYVIDKLITNRCDVMNIAKYDKLLNLIFFSRSWEEEIHGNFCLNLNHSKRVFANLQTMMEKKHLCIQLQILKFIKYLLFLIICT